MVLVSHAHRFIYLKTIRTASTTTEFAFEEFCADPEGGGSAGVPPQRQEAVSPYGVIGFRGPVERRPEKCIFFNHMDALLVREAVGEQVFRRYLKFANVRNPWDKVVSLYHKNRKQGVWQPAESMSLAEDLERFVLSYRRARVEELLFHETLGVDRFIRFEHLQEDVRALVDELDLPMPKILHFNKGGRPDQDRDFTAVLTRRASRHIREVFSDWIDHFRY